MEQFIFRHEKALSKTFNITHTLLKMLSFLLVLAVVINGTHYAMIHYKFPVTSEKASYYITSFIQNCLILALVFFAVKISLRYICYGSMGVKIRSDYVAKILKKSVLLGLAGQTFIYCFYFCCLSNETLVILSLCFLPIYIVLDALKNRFELKIHRAKRKQSLRLLQCLKIIAEAKCATIEI